jgi:hypothetical protein
MDDAAQLARARETLLHLYALSGGRETVLGAICLRGLGREDEIPVAARNRALLPPIDQSASHRRRPRLETVPDEEQQGQRHPRARRESGGAP